MTKDKPGYKKDVAFINREEELKYLRDYIDIRPESILFLHGPKSSGKTALLYRFLDTENAVPGKNKKILEHFLSR